MVISLRPIAQLGAFMTIIVFSGAYLSHWVFGPHYDGTQLPPVALRAFNSSLYFAAYGVGIFFLMANMHVGKVVLREFNYFIAFALLGLASIAWSLSAPLAVVESGQLILTIVTAAGITAGLSFRDFAKMLVWCSFVMMAGSLIYIFLIPSYGIMQAGPYSDLTGVPQGVFRHKNGLGASAAISIVVAAATAGVVSARLRMALLVTSVLCLFLSSSATSLAACVITLSTYYVWQLMNRLQYGRTFSILSLVILSVVIGIVFSSLLKVTLELLGRDSTLTGRTLIWEYVLDLIAERPFFGYGIASIWQLDLGNIPKLPYFAPVNAHNLFMEVTLQLGLLGLFLTILALGKIAVKLLWAQNVTTPAYRLLFVIYVYSFVDALAEFPLMAGNQSLFVVFLCCTGYFALEQVRGRSRKMVMERAGTPSGGEVPAAAG